MLRQDARTETRFGLSAKPPPECTSFYVGPAASADAHVLMGQNWDWMPRTSETTILAEITRGERPSFLMLAEAGLVGKIGFNSAGIGVSANALISDIDRGEPGVPFHVVLRQVLDARSLEEAVTAVLRARRSASANYVIGSSAGHGINVETGPGGVESAFMRHPTDDILAHTNHFTSTITFGDAGLPGWPDPPVQVATPSGALEEARGSLTIGSVPALLCDHTGLPNAVCRHPDEAEHPLTRSSTAASWIVDLTDGVVNVCGGTPCTGGAYVTIAPTFTENPPSMTR